MPMVEQRLTDRDISAWFDLNGTCLRIAARPEHLQPLLLYLAELRCPGPVAGARFDLSIGPQSFDPTPDGMALIFDGRLPEDVPCRLYEVGDTRLMIVPGRLSARFSLARGVMGVVAGSEWLIGMTAGILAIEAAAGLSVQTLVHAAALALPGRVDALMLFAPSGAGKTTTALALAAAGFGFLTDDAVFLCRAAGHAVASHMTPSHMAPNHIASGHAVWGLPRPLKVHRRTAILLPTVGALLTEVWDKNWEQGVSRRTLALIAPVPPPRPMPRPCWPCWANTIAPLAMAWSARSWGPH